MLTPKQKQAVQRNWALYQLNGSVARMQLLLNSAILTKEGERHAVDAITSMRRLIDTMKAIPGPDTHDHTATKPH